MSPKEKVSNIKRRLKARNAFDILHSVEDCHRDENGKFKKFKVYRFYFDRHVDIVSLWSFIFLSGVTFLVATLVSPLAWWLKLIIISFTLTIGLVIVLVAHENLILTQRLNEVLFETNGKNNK
jgi:hypothetical protein